jgi:branched-chain amino acid transport system substrate-binding protein
MKKALLCILAITLALLCNAESHSQALKPVVKIGVITPMSGDFAVLKELATIIDKRTAELNADPKNKFEYKLIFEDSKFDPKTSHMAAMKLLRVDKVDALLTIAALSVNVVAPLATQYRVPQLAVASENPSYGKWSFTYFNTSDDVAELALRAGKALGYKSFVVIGQRQEAILLYAAGLKKAAKLLGMEDKAEFLWNPTDIKDFRGYLLRTRELNPDFIMFPPTPPDPDIVFRQMRELGMTTPVAGTESFGLVEDKKWVEGRWVSGCPPMTPEMITKIKSYGVEPKLTYDPYVYDLVDIMVKAVEQAGTANEGKKPSGVQIREALANMKTVETTFGPVKQENNIFMPKPVLVYYQNGIGREVSIEELKLLKGVK